MQRLIDANELLKYKSDHETVSTHIIYNAPTVLAIPNNPANGDMIKALLPIKDEWEGFYVLTGKKQIYIKLEGSEDVISFDAEWWNAPYKPQESEV